MPERGEAHQAASPVRHTRPRAYESRWTWAIESKYPSGASARPSSNVDQNVEWHCCVRLTGLVDGVPAAEVVDLGVALFVADRVVEPDKLSFLVDLVDRDLVLASADADRSPAALHRPLLLG